MQSISHGQYVRTHDGASATGGVYPRFFMEEAEDPVASAEAGRLICRERELVEIVIPGDNSKVPVHPVSDVDRARWPEAYKAFREGLAPPLDGTPIEQWCRLSRAQVAELRYLGFRSIEHLANAADTALQRLPGGFAIREEALAFLDDAEATKLTAKLRAENDQLRSEVSNLQRQMTEQGELLRQVHAEMTAKNAMLHPYETTAPASVDPVALAALSHASAPTPAPLSSLDGFAVSPRRRRRMEAEGELETESAA